MRTPLFPLFRIVLSGLILLGFWYNLSVIENLRTSTGLFLTLYGILFLLSFVAVWKIQLSRSGLIVALAFAVIFRLLMLFTLPSQSNDIYRYVWDGKVTNHGISPYRYPPEASELEQLRTPDLYPKVGFKEMHSVYPPVIQGVNAALYKTVPDSPFPFKVFFLLMDLGIIGLLLLLLHHLKKPLALVLLYAWHPLPIFEFSGSGHNDVVMMFLLLLACVLFVKGKHLLSWTTLTLSIFTKIAPIFLIPWFFKHLRWWSISMLPLVALLLLLPFFLTAQLPLLLEGLKTYGGALEFNASFYTLFALLFPGHPEVVRFFLSLGLLFCITLIFFFYRKGSYDTFFRGILWILGLSFLFGSHVQPWYVAWLIPFLVLSFSPTWYFLTGAVMLSYLHYQGYFHVPNYLVLLLQYLPFYALLFFELGYFFHARSQSGKKMAFTSAFQFRVFPKKEEDPLLL